MKLCRVCKILLPIESFTKLRLSKDGLDFRCKACKQIVNASPTARASKIKWAKSNEGQKYMKDYHLAYMAIPENKERKSLNQWITRNTDENRRLMDKTYAASYCRRDDRKHLKNKKRRDLRQTSVEYRIMERLRGRIKNLLGRNRPEAASKSIGCSASTLREYLESKFKPGMSWENYGFYGWHIDHIKPLSSFNLLDPLEYRKACHYTNLQPLWALDNLKKGNKVA